jgi:hypothetical protein
MRSFDEYNDMPKLNETVQDEKTLILTQNNSKAASQSLEVEQESLPKIMMD